MSPTYIWLLNLELKFRIVREILHHNLTFHARREKGVEQVFVCCYGHELTIATKKTMTSIHPSRLVNKIHLHDIYLIHQLLQAFYQIATISPQNVVLKQ